MAAASATSPAAEEKPQAAEMDESRWQPLLALPCLLTIDLPLASFKVADFLQLQVNTVTTTGWRISRDVPLLVNGSLIAWGEFEASGNRLAVRLTELA